MSGITPTPLQAELLADLLRLAEELAAERVRQHVRLSIRDLRVLFSATVRAAHDLDYSQVIDWTDAMVTAFAAHLTGVTWPTRPSAEATIRHWLTDVLVPGVRCELLAAADAICSGKCEGR